MTRGDRTQRRVAPARRSRGTTQAKINPAPIMGALAVTLALASLVALLSASPARTQQTGPAPTPPEGLEAESWVLIEPDSGRYLTGEEADRRGATAATATIMTALVALEETESLESEVTVPEEAERFVGFTYSNVGLIAGERLSVRELLQAALISSGIDATYTLARQLGAGDPENFVQKMNAEAHGLGLRNTHFENPAGLDEEGNYSSARDLAIIAAEAMRNPDFAEIVGTGQTVIETQNREIELFNTNELLYAYPAANGIKTGSSPEAGSSVVASAERDGESYIAVVLGAQSAEAAGDAAQTVLEYGFEAYGERPLVHKGEAFADLALPYRRGEEVTLIAEEEIEALVALDSKVERRVSTRNAPEGAPAGETLGSVGVFVEGVKVGESPLVTAKDYSGPSIWDKARLAALWPVEKLWPPLREYFT